MSEAWPLVPLGDVLTKADDWIIPLPEQPYKEVTIRLWGKGVVERRQALGTEIGDSRRLRVQRQQFILSRIDARNGAFGLVPDSLDGAVVSNDFPAFTLHPARILPSFLEWMSKTHGFVDLCKAASEGTTNRVRLKEDRFLAMPVGLPPLPEQRRIVGRIEELAGKIEEARGLRREAAEGVEAIYEAKLQELVKSNLNTVQRIPFTQIARLERRPIAKKPDQKYSEIGVYCFGRGIFHKPPRTGIEIGDKDIYSMRDGDFVLQITFAWEGAVALAGAAEEGYCGSVRYLTFRVDEDVCHPHYLLTFMKSPEGISELARISPGSAGRNRVLSVKRLKEIMVPVVPGRSQQWLSEGLEAKMDALKALQGETEKELAALLPSVLDRAFSGRL